MNRPEQSLQIAVVKVLPLVLHPDVFWTAINPVPAKSKIVAALSKAMGLIAGVPDLLFIRDGCTMFLELKAERGRLSENQIAVSKRLTDAGVDFAVANSVDEAIYRLWQNSFTSVKPCRTFNPAASRD